MKPVKKTVRFADKESNQVHRIRKFKHPERIWWQPGELPAGGQILRSLLDTSDNRPYYAFRLSTPHDQARRIVYASYAVLREQAKRGGGCQSLRAQRNAAADYQAAMMQAPVWRGLEPLLMTTAVSHHVLAVLVAQFRNESLVEAARAGSRPSVQLAIERARFDAQQAGKKCERL